MFQNIKQKINKMANKNSDQTNDKNKHQTDYILYDLIIKDENYKLKSIMINLELNLRKIFKSIAIDPHKLKVLCKLNKSDGILLKIYSIRG